jgi:RND family efflux transporter MFP subunit
MSQSTRDPTALLAGLKIDRDAPAERPRSRVGLVLMLGAAVLGAGTAAMVFRDGATAGAATASATTAAEPAARDFPVELSRPRTTAEPDSVLDATGYVVARRQATVSAKTTGKVSEILVEEGMQVAEGQVIARLDDAVERAELELARAQLDAARSMIHELDAEIGHARRTLERTRALAARELVSRAELELQMLAEETLGARRNRAHREVTVAERRLAVQRQRLDDMEIRAPFAGVVVDKAAQPGEMVSPISAGGGFTRTGLGTIVDMSSLEVEVDVNEAYINRIHPAQAVIVTLNAYPGQRYPAEVLAVIPAADRTRATVGVRVGFRELDQRVLPDMGVRVAFLTTRVNEQEEGS